jgi:hypothetical protein
MTNRPPYEAAPALDTRIVELAQRHRFSVPAVWAAFEALRRGWGRMAQFDHPELGGMGQWSPGGMVMIGDMFNHDLKARVNALCADLAQLLADPGLTGRGDGAARQASAVPLSPAPPSSGHQWWPTSLGTPAAVGSQNNIRYAYFPQTRRLAVEQAGRLTVYDTGEHRISGFSQQQGPSQSWRFVSQLGEVSLQDLQQV